MCALHMTYRCKFSFGLYQIKREEIRKCIYIRPGLSSESCTIQWESIYSSFSTVRWRKEYEWLKRCHDFEEVDCFQFLAYLSACWAINNRKQSRASHEVLTLSTRTSSQKISGAVTSLSGKQRGTRRTVDVWHTRTSSDLKDNLQE